MPPVGPHGSLGQCPAVGGERSGRAMAATSTESRAREIFSTLDYGPAPESHACALVRACPPALPAPLPQPPGPVGSADSRDPPRPLRDPAPLGSRGSRLPLAGVPGSLCGCRLPALRSAPLTTGSFRAPRRELTVAFPRSLRTLRGAPVIPEGPIRASRGLAGLGIPVGPPRFSKDPQNTLVGPP